MRGEAELLSGLPSSEPLRSQSNRESDGPYTASASKKDVSVFRCWQTLDTPVPGAATERLNGMLPSVFRNDSIGSVELNGMFAAVPASSRWPMLWSTNWPHTLPHWVTPRSENTLMWMSLKT